MANTVLAPDEVLFLADRNMSEFHAVQALWTRAGEAVRHDDAQLVASSTRFPAGLFNCMEPLGPSPDRERAQGWLREACDFYAARERGFTVYVRVGRDHALAAACADLGMQALPASPGMVLDAEVSEPALPQGVRIERVADARGIADFAEVAAMAYTMVQAPETVTRSVFAEPERVLAPHVLLYVAYLDGAPAATVMTLLSHGIAGLYWVATKPELQRRGLADAITRRASNDAFARGAARVILQATPFGEPVYRRIGYREITRYAWHFLNRAQVATLALAGSARVGPA